MLLLAGMLDGIVIYDGIDPMLRFESRSLRRSKMISCCYGKTFFLTVNPVNLHIVKHAQYSFSTLSYSETINVSESKYKSI